MKKDLLLAIDVGTGSVRAALITLTGEMVAFSAREHDQIVPQFGWSEQRPASWWEGAVASVRAVHRQLAQHEDLAYNTVQTLMRIMEEKGLVDHQVEGRTFVYTPRFSRDESTARFLDRVFDGAADQLVMSLLRTERIAPEELDRMETMIAKARRRKGSMAERA